MARPGAMVRGLGMAVDLGATRVRACVATKSGKVVRRKSARMVITENVDDYLSQITSLVVGLARGPGRNEIQSVCVAAPGPLDPKRGVIVHTANLPYPEVPVVPAIQERFDGEVYLVNDANAGALGEWLWGAGRGRHNVFYLTISTGIGGGAIVDGRLLQGKEGNAAEVGHLTIDSTGKMKCGCGRWGHWEAYCSGHGIPAFTRVLGRELGEGGGRNLSRSPLLRRGGPADSAAVFRGAERGDPLALRVVAEVGKLNAVGVANIIDAYDPEVVTLGGGVALNNPEAVLLPIKKSVGEYAVNSLPEIRITPLGDRVGVLGALSVAFQPDLIGIGARD